MHKTMILVVTVLLFLTAAACGKEDEQHADRYKDDQMIGKVDAVKTEENRITVDISEWVKRDAGPVTTDEGYGISPQVTDKTVIEDENGNSTSLSEIKEGQKVNKPAWRSRILKGKQKKSFIRYVLLEKLLAAESLWRKS
ncbi:hypothetical protein [Alteribacillus bidgolensis]|uniref:Uncharacterized protein n=1 Tax=Alteribacillus bidgolensis TaxID=930129 RepID=A0A1G8KV41_9BACI|nr:hypothetical protein [Alteribacillus bidgolensis]SDI47246.1 hypothetical protein SAMN05216352_10824 [Alteribacillus bidgolensis]